MQAQPKLNFKFWFRKKREYLITISPDCKIDKSLKTLELPEDVLGGWFAHELGHLMDYKNRTAPFLILFGLMYSLFTFYRVGVERMADVFAIQFGFAAEILATKKFILSHSHLSDKYKQKIENYYMSPGEVEVMLQEKVESELIGKDAGLLP